MAYILVFKEDNYITDGTRLGYLSSCQKGF